MINTKTIISLLIITFCSFFAQAQITLPLGKQKKVDEALAEFHHYKDKSYGKASDFLGDACIYSYLSEEMRPNIILSAAYYEYIKNYNVNTISKYDNIDNLLSTIDKLSELKTMKKSYGLRLIYVNLWIDNIEQIVKSEKIDDIMTIPLRLTILIDMLEKMPVFKVEADLQQYYDLLPYPISEEAKDILLNCLYRLRKCFNNADYWLFAGVLALRYSEDYGKYLDKIQTYLSELDQISADALAGYVIEITKPRLTRKRKYELSDEDYAQMMDLYAKSAAKGNVLGCCRYADLIDADSEEKLKILARVESNPLFLQMTGNAVKATVLFNMGGIDNVREALHLVKESWANCYGNSRQLYDRKLYIKYHKEFNLLELQELERQIDYNEALPADLRAIAIGYESIEGQEEKAMEYYRKAAEAGDLGSLCRVCLYDIEQGVVDEDDDRVNNAINIILDNAESDFLPFLYNASYILLYNIDCKVPQEERLSKAIKYCDEYNERFKSDGKKSLYQIKHFLNCGNYTRTPNKSKSTDEDDLSRYDDYAYVYSIGLQYEKQKQYSEAQNYYWRAWFSGKHPLAASKMELMRKKLKELYELKKSAKK